MPRPSCCLLLLLLFTGCRTMPPPLQLEPVNASAVLARAQQQGLVPVQAYDAGIRTGLRYATPQNVFQRVLYPPGFPAMAAEATARKLAAAQRALKPHGLGLLVLDAYRPPEVQWQLFQLFKDDKYVADPRKKWSKHCYGRAVDVTLVELSGKEREMPGAFDDFTKQAAAAYAGQDPVVKRNLARLQQAMTSAGFSLYADEWWHFNDLSDPVALSGPPVFGRELGLAVTK